MWNTSFSFSSAVMTLSNSAFAALLDFTVFFGVVIVAYFTVTQDLTLLDVDFKVKKINFFHLICCRLSLCEKKP